jgi:Zn-dependent M16 (insulinase) family peptidase
LLNSVGKTYRGFLVTTYLPLKEIQSVYIELVHTESGAEVIQIANSDPENLFSLSFQTLPSSSNGVAHILEHTVLCGSKKFPVKDPFFSMTRRSLNTYMNALTGQDFTCYPAASQVEKDFYNLLDVYLDAVFHPKLNLLSFMQEGHRLAFAEIDNPASPLQIQGVVYNEMKGALTSPDSRLWFHLFKALTPDLPYAYDSGGDPMEIPSLTHRELVEFHRTFYHPSRCLFFFYGNLPLQKHLDFLLENALKDVQKEPLLPPLPPQPRFKTPHHVEEFYPIAANEDLKKKTTIALGYLTLSCSKQHELLALNLIDSLLTDTDVSPLKFALLKSGLCTNADSSLNFEMSEVPWVFICKGCEEGNGPKIAELIKTTLKEICRTGFDPKAIEASLHQLEFERTEILGGDAPFGLHLFFRTVLSKQHGADPSQALLIHTLFDELRKKISENPNYLTTLLRTTILENPHNVLLTLKPDPKLEQKEHEIEQVLLEKIRASLTESQIQMIFKQQKELLLLQEEQEHQSLDCLPKITLRDIPLQAKDYPLTEDHHVFHHNCFTNRIIYADLGFDLPAIRFEDLSPLSLLSRLITELGSGGRSYKKTLELQQECVGELSAAPSLYIQEENPNHCKPSFSFRSKALQRNAKNLFDLLRDTALSPKIQDPSRIQELLSQHATHLQNRITKQAMSYALHLALSGLSVPSAIQQEWNGLSYYHYIMRSIKKAPQELCNELEQIYKTLLGTNPYLVLSCAEEERRHIAPLLPNFFSSLPKHQRKPWSLDHPLHRLPAQAKIIASPVAFSVLAYSAPCNSAPLLIATNLLEHLVLHHEIREQGGAYGSGASYSLSTGHFYFHSYRDPHIARTYHSFLKAIDRIGSKKFTEEQLEEAKLSVLQDLDAPLAPGQRASTAYAWLRTGRTYKKRDAFRKAILETSREEIASALEAALKGKQGSFVSFAGSELLKKEEKSLPFPIEINDI